MTNKVNEGKFSCQYGYDLRNRLASANIARKEGLQDVTITSSYTYNTAGIRTRAEQTINGITQNRYFLLDSGHTGYAQVFEETSSLGGNLVRSYVLGDDVLSQNVGGVTSHLLYDGHGSTRQLAGDDGAVTANYAYDAYGKVLGGNPNVTDRQSATDLLYAGEQFDPGLQMEYLRARYYDQDNGRFNRLDPFDGNSEDPQSLHKYAYAHCDPINGVDPTGESLIGIVVITAILAIGIISVACLDKLYWSLYTIKKRYPPLSISNLTPENVIDKARSYLGSSYWSPRAYIDTYFVWGTNKCNKFVFDVLTELASNCVRYELSNKGFLRPPTAAEWANPNFFMAGWSLPIANPMPGSVISDGNHMGFLSEKQTAISASSVELRINEVNLERWGMKVPGRHPLHWEANK